MIFVKNKRRRLARSYAMWCVYLGQLLAIAPYIVPYFDKFIPWWASIAILALSPIGYLIKQPSLEGKDDGSES